MVVQLNKKKNPFELQVTRQLITLLTKNITFPCLQPDESISRPSIQLLHDYLNIVPPLTSRLFKKQSSENGINLRKLLM